MISSQPSEQYEFTILFLFLLFLNSDIGIVILYIVKYIRKAFSLPKKINFEVQNLTNIHVDTLIFRPFQLFADHMTQTGHRIKWDHFDILATGQSDIHCKIKEALLIRDLKPALKAGVHVNLSEILVSLKRG